jgi:hypothetical protein
MILYCFFILDQMCSNSFARCPCSKHVIDISSLILITNKLKIMWIVICLDGCNLFILYALLQCIFFYLAYASVRHMWNKRSCTKLNSPLPIRYVVWTFSGKKSNEMKVGVYLETCNNNVIYESPRKWEFYLSWNM